MHPCSNATESNEWLITSPLQNWMADEVIQSFNKSLLEKEYIQKLQDSSSWKLELDTHDQIVSTEVAKALWNVIGEHKVLSKRGKRELFKVLTAGVPMSVAPLILVKTIIFLNSIPTPSPY